MALLPCPKCGHQVDSQATACSACGHGPMNGVMPPSGTPAPSRAIPAEVSGWIMYPTPPELIEWARQTFNEEDFVAALREVEQTGGLELMDFIEGSVRAAAPQAPRP